MENLFIFGKQQFRRRSAHGEACNEIIAAWGHYGQ